jgi:dolichol kinase
LPDAAWLVIWLGILLGLLVGCILLHKLGVPRTFVRDILHIGTGVWVFGWPYWHNPAIPIALVGLICLVIQFVPLISPRLGPAAQLQGSISGGDEKWTGIAYYTISFLGMTILGLLNRPAPAAGAILALCLGDGIGGAVGLHLGRIKYRVPGAKTKSLEGSIAVAIAAGVGIALAGAWMGATPPLATIVVAGVVAAVVEALSPRATDNLAIPPAVWAVLSLMG